MQRGGPSLVTCQAGHPGEPPQAPRGLPALCKTRASHPKRHLPSPSALHEEEFQHIQAEGSGDDGQPAKVSVSTVLSGFCWASQSAPPRAGQPRPPASMKPLPPHPPLDPLARPAPPGHVAICWFRSRSPGEGPRLEEMGGKARILASKISGRKCLVSKKGTDKAYESYKEKGLLFI